jgi:hypothetical protein
MDINENKCPKCGMIKTYSEKYDAYYCGPCNEWLEDICTDRDCLYCNNRPLIPNEQNIKES